MRDIEGITENKKTVGRTGKQHGLRGLGYWKTAWVEELGYSKTAYLVRNLGC
jgi:hypothetical protein